MPFHIYVDFVMLEELSRSMQTKLISSLEKKYYLELPPKLITKIIRKRHSPGYINSLYRYLGMMDSLDFDKLISQGTGSQLLWLLILCLVLWLTLYAVSNLFFAGLVWQDIVALFLDPGCFGGADKHDVFRLAVALLGCFTFSALLVSVFSNIIDNISDNWRQGRLRYTHKEHIIIFGLIRIV